MQDMVLAAPSAPAAINDVLWVDTNDVCNLKCPTCIRGVRGMPNSPVRLPLDTFGLIVGKAAAEGYKRVGLFNWTEPFLNPALASYMQLIKNAGLSSGLSSNFSLRRIPHLEAVLRLTDHLIVSVSGHDQAVYEINHVAGCIDYVKANLRRAAELAMSGKISTYISLRLLKFSYNHGEEPKLRGFADEFGIHFEVLEGVGDPTVPIAGLTNESLAARPAFLPATPRNELPSKVCPLVFGQTPIDSRGDAYLCCAYPNYEVMRIGHYLEMSPQELLLARHNHPVCHSCDMARRNATEEDRAAYAEALRA